MLYHQIKEIAAADSSLTYLNTEIKAAPKGLENYSKSLLSVDKA